MLQWSYGILFWEVLTRGKRPYDDFPYNKYVPTYIIKGYRMSLPDYVPENVLVYMPITEQVLLFSEHHSCKVLPGFGRP